MSAIGQTGTRSATPSAPTDGTPPSTGQADGTPPEQEQQSQPRQRADGFWGRFPTVPEDQREALEPHLKTVQGYVTKLEQQLAPFRGYTPQQVQGLAKFAKSFDANPLQSFLAIAQQLQARGVIHEDLDLELLSAVAQGQEIQDDVGNAPPDTEVPGEEAWRDAPPWALELRAKQQREEQERTEQARANRERQEDAVLDHQLSQAKAKLKAAGFPDEYLNNEGLEKDLVARFLVHGGKLESVVQELSGLRTTLLQGAVRPNNDQSVDLPRGVPPSGRTASQRRASQRPGDSFAQASAAAEQHMRSAMRQGG
jgi:hypothetical protein